MKRLLKLFVTCLCLFTFILPIHAENTDWVVDDTNLLTKNELDSLNARIQTLVDTYDMGIYIRLKNDMESFYDIETYGEFIYKSEQMGIGSNQSGILLTMEFYDRNYDILAYGDGNIAFTDYGKEYLEDEMLPSFRYDDWYEGFTYFLDGVEMELERYRMGTPYDIQPAPPKTFTDFIYLYVLAPIISLVICLIQANKHKTAKIATTAGSYIEGNGLRLTARNDQYTHTTRTVTHIPKNNGGGGGGGTTVNSGGFSHSSGKF